MLEKKESSEESDRKLEYEAKQEAKGSQPTESEPPMSPEMEKRFKILDRWLTPLQHFSSLKLFQTNNKLPAIQEIKHQQEKKKSQKPHQVKTYAASSRVPLFRQFYELNETERRRNNAAYAYSGIDRNQLDPRQLKTKEAGQTIQYLSLYREHLLWSVLSCKIMQADVGKDFKDVDQDLSLLQQAQASKIGVGLTFGLGLAPLVIGLRSLARAHNLSMEAEVSLLGVGCLMWIGALLFSVKAYTAQKALTIRTEEHVNEAHAILMAS